MRRIWPATEVAGSPINRCLRKPIFVLHGFLAPFSRFDVSYEADNSTRISLWSSIDLLWQCGKLNWVCLFLPDPVGSLRQELAKLWQVPHSSPSPYSTAAMDKLCSGSTFAIGFGVQKPSRSTPHIFALLCDLEEASCCLPFFLVHETNA